MMENESPSKGMSKDINKASSISQVSQQAGLLSVAAAATANAYQTDLSHLHSMIANPSLQKSMTEKAIMMMNTSLSSVSNGSVPLAAPSPTGQTQISAAQGLMNLANALAPVESALPIPSVLSTSLQPTSASSMYHQQQNLIDSNSSKGTVSTLKRDKYSARDATMQDDEQMQKMKQRKPNDKNQQNQKSSLNRNDSKGDISLADQSQRANRVENASPSMSVQSKSDNNHQLQQQHQQQQQSQQQQSSNQQPQQQMKKTKSKKQSSDTKKYRSSETENNGDHSDNEGDDIGGGSGDDVVDNGEERNSMSNGDDAADDEDDLEGDDDEDENGYDDNSESYDMYSSSNHQSSGEHGLQGDRPGHRRPQHWTREEDAQLRTAVAMYDEKNWRKVAEMVPGRNSTQCLQRWQKVLRPGLRKGQWNKDEDDLLSKIVLAEKKKYGATRLKLTWNTISKQIPGRTPKQCRERWNNNINPNIRKGPWEQWEDNKLLDAIRKHGAQHWSQIARALDVPIPFSTEYTYRTESTTKNRYIFLSKNLVEMTNPLKLSEKAALETANPNNQLEKSKQSPIDANNQMKEIQNFAQRQQLLLQHQHHQPQQQQQQFLPQPPQNQQLQYQQQQQQMMMQQQQQQQRPYGMSVGNMDTMSSPTSLPTPSIPTLTPHPSNEYPQYALPNPAQLRPSLSGNTHLSAESLFPRAQSQQFHPPFLPYSRSDTDSSGYYSNYSQDSLQKPSGESGAIPTMFPALPSAYNPAYPRYPFPPAMGLNNFPMQDNNQQMSNFTALNALGEASAGRPDSMNMLRGQSMMPGYNMPKESNGYMQDNMGVNPMQMQSVPGTNPNFQNMFYPGNQYQNPRFGGGR